MLDHRRRVLVTLAAVILVLGGSFLPLPGIPASLLSGWRADSPFPQDRLRVLSLGIQPYVTASALWLLLSGLIDPLRRKREGSTTERAAFDRFIIWLALGLALVQGLLNGVFIRNLGTLAGLDKMMPSSWLVAVDAVAGTAVLIAIALFVTRAGVGNGVVWVVLATSYLAALPTSVSRELALAGESNVGSLAVPIAVSALVGLIVVCWWYLQSALLVPLVPIEGGKTPAPRPQSLPLRLNLIGVAPVVFATSLLALPSAVGGLFPDPPRWTVLPPVIYWVLFSVLVVVMSYFFTGIGFDTRRVGAMLARHGYRLEGAEGRSPDEHLDQLIEKRLLLSSIVLVAIVLLPGPVLKAATGVSLSRAGLSGEVVLVVCAIVFDAVRGERSLRDARLLEAGEEAAADTPNAVSSSDAGESSGEAATDAGDPVGFETWVTAFESDVELESRLALATLEANGIRGIVRSNRVIPLLGTLSPYEWTNPTYPSLMIHRRLGGGRVVLRVAESDSERARELLAEGTTAWPGPPGAEG
jgi:preprotein translocase subunit SecY